MVEVTSPNHSSRQGAHTIGREWAIGMTTAVVAVATVAVARHMRDVAHHSYSDGVVAAAALVLVVSAVYAIRHLGRATGRTVARRASLAAGATVRLVVNGVGIVLLIFGLFGVLGVSLQHLLIGAGLTGIIVGIAAQQSLANVFAAIVLLFARPFVVGEQIRIRSGVLGVLDVTVLGAGLTYVTVRTDDGILKIPNSVMLASGIGRLHDPPSAPPAS